MSAAPSPNSIVSMRPTVSVWTLASSAIHIRPAESQAGAPAPSEGGSAAGMCSNDDAPRAMRRMASPPLPSETLM